MEEHVDQQTISNTEKGSSANGMGYDISKVGLDYDLNAGSIHGRYNK